MAPQMSATIPKALTNASFAPVPCGERVPAGKWGDVHLSPADARARLDQGSNLALRGGRDSGLDARKLDDKTVITNASIQQLIAELPPVVVRS
jgi:hypothetical protein